MSISDILLRLGLIDDRNLSCTPITEYDGYVYQEPRLLASKKKSNLLSDDHGLKKKQITQAQSRQKKNVKGCVDIRGCDRTEVKNLRVIQCHPTNSMILCGAETMFREQTLFEVLNFMGFIDDVDFSISSSLRPLASPIRRPLPNEKLLLLDRSFENDEYDDEKDNLELGNLGDESLCGALNVFEIFGALYEFVMSGRTQSGNNSPINESFEAPLLAIQSDEATYHTIQTVPKKLSLYIRRSPRQQDMSNFQF